MGLTIHYSLAARDCTLPAARRHVAKLRQTALDLPFDEVGPLVEWRVAAGQAPDFPGGMLHAGSGRSHPETLIAFRIQPGPGCESAEFGLERYAARPGARRRRVSRTWHWTAFCKTQYASDPRHGGIENFLRCHLGLVALLDAAKKLGLAVKVRDEGGYWRRRRRDELVREIGQWNEMVASCGGALKDAHPDAVTGPIFAYPDFEHLEARGAKRPKR